MKIQPIVEGHGDVDAVPALLHRLGQAGGLSDLVIGRPIRKKRGELVQETPLKRAVRLAMIQRGCEGVMVIFDADDDCPKELAPRIQSWASEEAAHVPCEIVMPKCEYEAWFLGAIASLRERRGIRADAAHDADPEAVRGAKERLQEFMSGNQSYLPSVDQKKLTALFDLGAAYRRCRSFRKMAGAFGTLVKRMGGRLREWPPRSWRNLDSQQE